jgi:6-phosphogluconolactonase
MTERTIYANAIDRLGKAGSEIIADSLSEGIKRKGFAVLGVPGGRSVKAIFDHIAHERSIDWHNVHIFLVDERLVERTHPDSNFKLAFDSFISGLLTEGRIGQRNIHAFDLIPDSRDLGISAYNVDFARFGGFDCIVLGVGEDGHVGALYPRHHSIKNPINEYFTMSDSPKPPKDRMTGSRSMFEAADTAIALFIGEAKRDAHRIYLDPAVSVEDCPVKLIRMVQNRYILTDLK